MHVEEKMIARIWHGYTTPQNADVYEKLLTEEVIIGIQGRRIPGFQQIKVLRRELEAETEFITIMEFDSLDAVKDFAGEDYEGAMVPEAARAVLSHFDARSQHYEIKAALAGK
jgi:heme-degrading monooxygenase HmoA